MGIRRIKTNENIEAVEIDYENGYTSKNKMFNLVIYNGKKTFIQFNKETGLQERIMSFKQGTALFRGFFANKIIKRIQIESQLSRKDALSIYHTNKDQIKENRITNIQGQEGFKTRNEATVFYNDLIRKGNYKKIQMYGS